MTGNNKETARNTLFKKAYEVKMQILLKFSLL